jgi:transposase
MAKLYVVSLSDSQLLMLQATAKNGKTSARTAARARILLKADAGPEGPEWSDTKIAEAFEVSRPTVERIRKRTVTEGVDAVLQERRRGTVLPKLDGAHEARLTALACSAPPSGQKRWTLHLLANHFGDREGVPISYELVRRTLKKNRLSPHLKRQWCIPPEQNAEFCWRMEDVLDVYTRPYDPSRPQVCFDERPVQLLADVREPTPGRPGASAREDYEYERKGTANLFLWYEPLRSYRHVEVTEHRRRDDWAHCIKDLVDVHYPDAKKIVLVMDNLNIHSPASLYVTFEPKEAKRLADKLEIHYTPKHGSWLDMAEIELAILASQCLDRRIPGIKVLATEIAAWVRDRNETTTAVNWRFTTADARIKLKRLYPSHQA